MKFILAACAVLFALIALGNYRYVQSISHRYDLARPEIEQALFEGLVAQDELLRQRVLSLRIVPGQDPQLLGLQFEVRLVGQAGTATVFLDMDAAIRQRHLLLRRPCLRSATHSMTTTGTDAVSVKHLLLQTLDRLVETPLGAALPQTVREQPSAYGQARPVTRVEVAGDALTLTLGLLESRAAEEARWTKFPDPRSPGCSARPDGLWSSWWNQWSPKQ